MPLTAASGSFSQLQADVEPSSGIRPATWWISVEIPGLMQVSIFSAVTFGTTELSV